MEMENNLHAEIINNLAIKIANLEVQVAALTAENKEILNQYTMLQEENKGGEVDEAGE